MKELFKNLKFVWNYTKNEKGKLIILTIINIIQIIISVIFPILSARVVVSLTTNEYFRILLIAIIILILDSIYNCLSYFVRIITIKIHREVLSKLEVDLGKNVLKLENTSLDKNGSGVFIQRLTGDTSNISGVFNSLLEILTRIITYIGILIAMFIVNKLVFLYVICTLIILYVLERIRTSKKNECDKEARKAKEKVSGFIGELVRGARDIKMLNSENDFIKELSNRIDDANYKQMKMKKVSWNYFLIIDEFDSVFSFLLIVLLVILIKDNILIPTTALVLYNYFGRVSGLIYSVGSLLEYTKDFNLSSERISAIIDDKEFSKEKFGNKHLAKVNGDFEFKNVTFKYDKKYVLKDLSFNVNANETVAFVGKSGAGKTTIFNLLCKMYDVNSGTITIDGVNINELDKDSIRGNITIISQNPYIFNMSIRDNLKLVKSDLTEKAMKEACKIACLEDFINNLPNGYDTVIGEGGINLSGGQKQRLAIARALVQKTEIILFDEATSALDNETQRKIQEAINNMKNEYTILIIAHRLSTIINADRILYLDNGKIVAEGTHKELLKNCEEYKKLYESEIIKKNDN